MFYKSNNFIIGLPTDRKDGEKRNPIFIIDTNKKKIKRVQTWEQFRLYQKKQYLKKC